jgi:hypothetical protein
MCLDNAYGIDQCHIVRQCRDRQQVRCRPAVSRMRGRWRRGLTCAGVAEAEEMQEEREKGTREPSLEAATRRTSGSASSPWSKKTARKRVRQERSRTRRISRRYAASSQPRASIARCAVATAVAIGRRLLEVLAASVFGQRWRVSVPITEFFCYYDTLNIGLCWIGISILDFTVIIL